MKMFTLFICCFVLFSCTKNKLVKDFETQEVPESATEIHEFQLVAEENEDDQLRQKDAHGQIVISDHLVKLDDFQKAIITYQEVYEDENYKDEQRGEALFKLAAAHECILNDNIDMDKSLYYYQLLIAEFPASKYRLDAFQRIGSLRIKIEDRDMNQNKTKE